MKEAVVTTPGETSGSVMLPYPLNTSSIPSTTTTSALFRNNDFTSNGFVYLLSTNNLGKQMIFCIGFADTWEKLCHHLDEMNSVRLESGDDRLHLFKCWSPMPISFYTALLRLFQQKCVSMFVLQNLYKLSFSDLCLIQSLYYRHCRAITLSTSATTPQAPSQATTNVPSNSDRAESPIIDVTTVQEETTDTEYEYDIERNYLSVHTIAMAIELLKMHRPELRDLERQRGIYFGVNFNTVLDDDEQFVLFFRGAMVTDEFVAELLANALWSTPQLSSLEKERFSNGLFMFQFWNTIPIRPCVPEMMTTFQRNGHRPHTQLLRSTVDSCILSNTQQSE